MKPTLLAFDIKNEYILNQTTGVTVAQVFASPASFINILLPTAYVVSGLVILFLFVFGGLSIIMAGDNQKGVDKGKEAIKSAVIGFLIIFTAYWIIQIIEIVIGVQILNPGF